MQPYRPIILATLLAVVVGAVSAPAAFHTDEMTTITLTSGGFKPQHTSVEVGQTVRFVSEIPDREFWPASDSHPTHGIFEDFDPKRPLQPSESWEFTFDKLGSWEYHDHLNSQLTGTVSVYSQFGEKTAECVVRGESGGRMKQDPCWVEELVALFANEGEEAVFGVIDTYVQNDEIFNRNCHDTMHAVGDYGYELYAASGEPVLHPGTSYCGYGYYHGFIERMIEEEGSYESAVAYCTRIGSDPRHLAPGYGNHAESGCQHGFGHSLFDSLEGSLWGDVDLMVNTSLERCSELFEDEHPHFQCATGVFNALMLALANKWYDLSYDLVLDDPYRICRETDDFYKPACYIDMVVHHTWWAKLPHEEIFSIVKAIEHEESRLLTLEAFTSNVVQRELPKTIEARFAFTKNCFDFPEESMQRHCLTGVHHGIFQRTNQYTNQAESEELCNRFEVTRQSELCTDMILKRNYEDL